MCPLFVCVKKGTRVHVKLTQRTAYLPTDHQERSGTSDWLRSIYSFMVKKSFDLPVFCVLINFLLPTKHCKGLQRLFVINDY